MIKIKLFVVAIFLGITQIAFAGVISCSNLGLNAVETNICSNKQLLQLDRQLNQYFGRLKVRISEPDPLVTQQRLWTKHIRDVCKNIDCLIHVYKKRVLDLKNYHSHISVFDNNIVGRYNYAHEVEFNGVPKKLTDSMVLFKDKHHKLKASILLYGGYGNICEVEGDAYLNQKIPHQIQISTENKKCKLTLSFNKGFVELHDYQGVCRIDACGIRLGLDGYIFLRDYKSFKPS